MAAAERLNETGGVGLALQGQRGQLQTGNPAFGAPFQGGDVCLREGQAHHLGEKFAGFGGGEAQVGHPQLAQVVPRAPPSQRELGIGPRGEDQVQLGGQVLDQIGEGLVHRVARKHVVVV